MINQINIFLLLMILVMLLGLYSIQWVLADYDKIQKAIEVGKEDEANDWDIWDIGWQVCLLISGFICGFIVRGI